jgi:uncharacterized protein YciI
MAMASPSGQDVYYVVFCTLNYGSLEEAKVSAFADIVAHVERSKTLHGQGTLVMAGAFLDQSDEPLRTMAVLTSREAAEAYVKGDPFYLAGMMQSWEIREWANMFA